MSAIKAEEKDEERKKNKINILDKPIRWHRSNLLGPRATQCHVANVYRHVHFRIYS